jgi:hypothetical protein
MRQVGFVQQAVQADMPGHHAGRLQEVGSAIFSTGLICDSIPASRATLGGLQQSGT